MARLGRGRTLPDGLLLHSGHEEPTGSLARLSPASPPLKRGLLFKHSLMLAKCESPRLLFQTSFWPKGLGFGILVSTFLNLKCGLAFGKVRLAFGILHKIRPAGNDYPFPHKFDPAGKPKSSHIGRNFARAGNTDPHRTRSNAYSSIRRDERMTNL